MHAACLTRLLVAAGNPGRAGEWLQLVGGIVGILSTGCALLYFFATRFIVSLLTPDTEVAEMAGVFNEYYAVGTLLLAANFVFRQYVNGLMEATGPMIGAASTVLFAILFNKAFIFGVPSLGLPGLGFTGCPLATNAAQLAQFIIFVLFSFVWKRVHLTRSAWKGTDFASSCTWERLCTYAALAVPATMGGIFEACGKAPRLLLMYCHCLVLYLQPCPHQHLTNTSFNTSFNTSPVASLYIDFIFH